MLFDGIKGMLVEMGPGFGTYVQSSGANAEITTGSDSEWVEHVLSIEFGLSLEILKR